MLTETNLGNILRKKGITLHELAEQMNFPFEELEEIYLGRKNYSNQLVKQIAEALAISEEELLKNSKKSIYENIGALLRQVREEKKITLVELGKKSGVSYTHISEIERGKTCASLKTLEKLAKVLDVPTSHFFLQEECFTLGDKVRRLREKQNLTQRQVADAIGVSLSLIGQIETDRVKPALDTLQSIAEVFGVSISYFLLSESQEMALRKCSWDQHGKLEEIFAHLEASDIELISELVAVLKNHNLLGHPVYDSQTKELLDIFSLLSNEDKAFIINNARWILKKAKKNSDKG